MVSPTIPSGLRSRVRPGSMDLSECVRGWSRAWRPAWKWMGVRNLPLAGQRVTWFVARVPDLRSTQTSLSIGRTTSEQLYDEDISAARALQR